MQPDILRPMKVVLPDGKELELDDGATGLDAAVKTLGHAPFGKVLLILAALGIAAFGAYSFVRSRHGRM